MLPPHIEKLLRENRDPDRIMLTEAEAAAFLGVSISFVQDLRKFQRVTCLLYQSPHPSGRVVVRYRLSSLQQYQRQSERFAITKA
jgi:hypothetical protein